MIRFVLLACVVLIGCTQKSVEPDTSDAQAVVMETELGRIVVEIYPNAAPLTAANFLRYVDEARWDSAYFYRVVTMSNQPNNDVKIEVIQGGLGFSENPQRLEAIAHETTETTRLLHKDGTISMARSRPGTASSEFFICVGDQPELDFAGKRNPDGQGFATFGQVIEGMDVVRAIQQGANTNQMLDATVAISSIERMTANN